MKKVRVSKNEDGYFINGISLDTAYVNDTSCCGMVEIDDLQYPLERNIKLLDHAVSLTTKEIIYHTIKATLYNDRIDKGGNVAFALVSLLKNRFSKELSDFKNGVIASPVRKNPNTDNNIQIFIIDIRKFSL